VTEKQERVLSNIPYGAENAILGSALAAKSGVSNREMQEIIEAIIEDEIAPVCSSCRGKMGYFRPVSAAEMEAYHKQLISRARNVMDRYIHSVRMMNRHFVSRA
jgi:hypothetical protein